MKQKMNKKQEAKVLEFNTKNLLHITDFHLLSKPVKTLAVSQW